MEAADAADAKKVRMAAVAVVIDDTKPKQTAAEHERSESERASLLERLTATAEARHKAIRASRPDSAVRRYEPNAWLSMLVAFRNRRLDVIAVPLLVIGLVACAVTPMVVISASSDVVCPSLEAGRFAFQLVLSALAFLLVFRLNRAALRHYEARQLCGWIMIHCRDLAMSSNAALGKRHPETRDALCEVAVAFPIAFMLHMWGDHASRATAFETMTDGVIADPATRLAIIMAAHRPLALIQYAQAILHDAIFSAQADATTSAPSDGPSGHMYRMLLDSIRGMGVPLGGCERIQGTPLPFVYVAHLRSFLLVVLCAVPVVYGCEWRWATLPLSLGISFGLLGIEAASVECERPFSPMPSKNHHDVERFAELISTEVRDMLGRQRLLDGGADVAAASAVHHKPLAKSRTLYGLSKNALQESSTHGPSAAS